MLAILLHIEPLSTSTNPHYLQSAQLQFSRLFWKSFVSLEIPTLDEDA